MEGGGYQVHTWNEGLFWAISGVQTLRRKGSQWRPESRIEGGEKVWTGQDFWRGVVDWYIYVVGVELNYLIMFVLKCKLYRIVLDHFKISSGLALIINITEGSFKQYCQLELFMK